MNLEFNLFMVNLAARFSLGSAALQVASEGA